MPNTLPSEEDCKLAAKQFLIAYKHDTHKEIVEKWAGSSVGTAIAGFVLLIREHDSNEKLTK